MLWSSSSRGKEPRYLSSFSIIATAAGVLTPTAHKRDGTVAPSQRPVRRVQTPPPHPHTPQEHHLLQSVCGDGQNVRKLRSSFFFLSFPPKLPSNNFKSKICTEGSTNMRVCVSLGWCENLPLVPRVENLPSALTNRKIVCLGVCTCVCTLHPQSVMFSAL